PRNRMRPIGSTRRTRRWRPRRHNTDDKGVQVRSIAMVFPLLAATLGAAASDPAPIRQARMADVVLTGETTDLLRPEGKTRWDRSGLKVGPGHVRTLRPDGDGIALTDETTATIRYADTDGISARRWLLPDGDHEKLRPGTRERLELIETRGGVETRLR